MTTVLTSALKPEQADPGDVAGIRGDPAALERFYLAYYDDVVRFFTRRVTDPHDVADLVADTFVAAVDACHTYDCRRGAVMPWLIGIAHNKLRRLHRRRGLDLAASQRIRGRRLLDADDIADLEERIDAAASGAGAALAALSAAHREVIDLELQGFTPAETAKILGVSAGLIRIRLHRARKAMRNALEQNGGRG